MTARALVLTYHAVEAGPPPLCVEPALFRAHMDCLTDVGASTLTVTSLAYGLKTASLPPRAVAITFDDGFASVIDNAAPTMADHGFRGTIFCVAGHLGKLNDWPSQPGRAPRRPLAAARDLEQLVEDADFEIGSHGMHHEPLDQIGPELLRREVSDSRRELEQSLGVGVRSYAYPYGIVSNVGRAAVRECYSAACTDGTAIASMGADPFEIVRVDAHYLRDPALLKRAVVGRAGAYLAARRCGGRVRRMFTKDYAKRETSRT